MISRVCKAISKAIATDEAVAGAIIFQFLWVTLLGFWLKLDPFPFTFLLTLSNIIQLILIFVIARAQRDDELHGKIDALHGKHDKLHAKLADL